MPTLEGDGIHKWFFFSGEIFNNERQNSPRNKNSSSKVVPRPSPIPYTMWDHSRNLQLNLKSTLISDYRFRAYRMKCNKFSWFMIHLVCVISTITAAEWTNSINQNKWKNHRKLKRHWTHSGRALAYSEIYTTHDIQKHTHNIWSMHIFPSYSHRVCKPSFFWNRLQK